MYKIMRNGVTIGITEQVVFNRRQTNGYFVECSEAEAQGFVYGGTVYSLLGREGYADMPEASLAEFDGGAAIATLEATVDDLVVSSLMGGGASV